MGKMYGHTVGPYRLATNKDDLEKIALNANLSKTDYRLFILLACRMTTEDIIQLDKKQLAKTLDVDKKDIDKSLDRLLEENIIEEGRDKFSRKGFRFSYSKRPSSSKGIIDTVTYDDTY